jgi:hypothetical protein
MACHSHEPLDIVEMRFRFNCVTVTRHHVAVPSNPGQDVRQQVHDTISAHFVDNCSCSLVERKGKDYIQDQPQGLKRMVGRYD